MKRYLNIKTISFVLLFFCVVAMQGGICQAADQIQVQEQVIKQLLTNSNKLDELMTIFRMNSSEAQQQLLIVTEQLQISKKELAELKQQHQQLQKSYNRMMDLSQKQSESIEKINQSFTEYSKEVKKKITSLERQKKLLEIVATVAATYAVVK